MLIIVANTCCRHCPSCKRGRAGNFYADYDTFSDAYNLRAKEGEQVFEADAVIPDADNFPHADKLMLKFFVQKRENRSSRI